MRAGKQVDEEQSRRVVAVRSLAEAGTLVDLVVGYSLAEDCRPVAVPGC